MNTKTNSKFFPTTSKQPMIFTLERPISDQLVESILEHPEEWTICHNRHYHKSGLRLGFDGTRTFVYGLCEDIIFTQDESALISKAAKTMREEDKAAKDKKAKARLISIMNRSEARKNKLSRLLTTLAFVGSIAGSVILVFWLIRAINA